MTQILSLNNGVQMPALGLDVFDFDLSGVELALIDSLDLGIRRGPEPDAVRPPNQFTIPEA